MGSKERGVAILQKELKANNVYQAESSEHVHPDLFLIIGGMAFRLLTSCASRGGSGQVGGGGG